MKRGQPPWGADALPRRRGELLDRLGMSQREVGRTVQDGHAALAGAGQEGDSFTTPWSTAFGSRSPPWRRLT